MRRIDLILLFAPLLFLACKKTDGAHLFHPTNAEGWNSGDMLVFDIEPSSRERDYDLMIDLRIDNRYQYQDIWLVADQHYKTVKHKPARSATSIELRDKALQDSLDAFVPHHQHFTDTIHLQLVKDNIFSGEGNNLITYRMTVRKVRLIKHEQGTIRIHHMMDEKSLVGVHDVGISLTPVAE